MAGGSQSPHSLHVQTKGAQIDSTQLNVASHTTQLVHKQRKYGKRVYIQKEIKQMYHSRCNTQIVDSVHNQKNDDNKIPLDNITPSTPSHNHTPKYCTKHAPGSVNKCMRNAKALKSQRLRERSARMGRVRWRLQRNQTKNTQPNVESHNTQRSQTTQTNKFNIYVNKTTNTSKTTTNKKQDVFTRRAGVGHSKTTSEWTLATINGKHTSNVRK